MGARLPVRQAVPLQPQLDHPVGDLLARGGEQGGTRDESDGPQLRRRHQAALLFSAARAATAAGEEAR